MRIPSHFWSTCQYRLHTVMAGEDIARAEGWRRHWHPFWVIDVWGGARGWSRVRGTVHRRGPNSVAIYAPRVVYEEKCESGHLVSWAWVLLEETEGTSSPLRKLIGSAGFAMIEDPTDEIRKTIQNMFETASTDSPGRSFLLSSHVDHTVGMLLNLGASPGLNSAPEKKTHKQWVHPWKRTARIELERTFPDALSIQKLASALGISPSTLTHKYKTLCGESFKETIQHWRLEKAHVLLRKKDISIKEIATRLGISQPSYLTAFLKKATGYSPSELRNMLHQQD